MHTSAAYACCSHAALPPPPQVVGIEASGVPTQAPARPPARAPGAAGGTARDHGLVRREGAVFSEARGGAEHGAAGGGVAVREDITAYWRAASPDPPPPAPGGCAVSALSDSWGWAATLLAMVGGLDRMRTGGFTLFLRELRALAESERRPITAPLPDAPGVAPHGAPGGAPGALRTPPPPPHNTRPGGSNLLDAPHNAPHGAPHGQLEGIDWCLRLAAHRRPSSAEIATALATLSGPPRDAADSPHAPGGEGWPSPTFHVHSSLATDARGGGVAGGYQTGGEDVWGGAPPEWVREDGVRAQGREVHAGRYGGVGGAKGEGGEEGLQKSEAREGWEVASALMPPWDPQRWLASWRLAREISAGPQQGAGWGLGWDEHELGQAGLGEAEDLCVAALEGIAGAGDDHSDVTPYARKPEP
ncbi:hypothetical protein T484DRAFT_1833297 [Baffinella frigidus]|nr:hypothetical protein T484DRAFT_1833297 [Cryptophyta sp. CCMP2293]